MGGYLLKRLGATSATLIVVITVAFLILRLAPGDPVQVLMGEFHSPEAERALRARYGLDRPIYIQYLAFIRRSLTADLGDSLRDYRPVTHLIGGVFPYTVHLAVLASLIALCLGVPLGVMAAVRRGQWQDLGAMLIAVLGRSVPNFWLALLLIFFFSFRLDVFPPIGVGDGTIIGALSALVLPAFVLGFDQAAFLARLTRSGVLDVLGQEYVRVARAKGLKERTVIYRHALRNGMLPVITQVGLMVGRLLGGAVVVERVFTRPGLGQLLVDAVAARDYPVVQGVVLWFGVLFVSINLLVDLLYGLWDPRVRYA